MSESSPSLLLLLTTLYLERGAKAIRAQKSGPIYLRVSHLKSVRIPSDVHCSRNIFKVFELTVIHFHLTYAVASLGIHNHGFPLLVYSKNPRVPIQQSRVKPHKILGFQTPNFQIHGFHGTRGTRPNAAPGFFNSDIQDLHGSKC